MAKRNVDVGVSLSGEEKYKAALKELNQGNQVLAAEMKKLRAEFQGNTESMEFYTAKGDLLERQLAQQHDKVEELRQALAHAAQSYGESSATAQKYQKELYEAEAAEFKLQHAIEDNTAAMQGQNEEMIGLGDTVDKLASKLGINLPDSAKDALNGMDSFSAGTVAAMGAAAAAIAAVIKATKELGEMTIEAAAKVDEYLTESMITDVPTQILQAWDYAAPLIDVDADTIKNGMVKITKAMGEAAAGNDAAIERFEALGVSITDADGQLRSSEDVLYDVVDALGKIENATERDVAAQELFGKSFGDLKPLINAGSAALKEYYKEAEAVGYILSDDQVKALGEVDDAYQRLQLTIEAQKMMLSAEFAPAVKDAMEVFTKWVQKAGQYLVDSGIIQNLAAIVQNLVSILDTGGEMLSGMPGFQLALDALKVTLGAVAQFTALIADAADVIAGLFTLDWGRMSTGLGLQKNSGNASRWQTVYMQQEGTYDQYAEYYANKRGQTTRSDVGGYDPATGLYYDKDGNYLYGHNAGGTDNWRGGLTWVGESGPELVSLPRGTQIINAQESKQAVGDTFYITMNVNENAIHDLQALVNWAKRAQETARKRPSSYNQNYAPMPNPGAFHG